MAQLGDTTETHENDKGTKMKQTESVSDYRMAIKGYSVGSGSLGEPFWKRALESGGLKEGLEQDQLGVGEGALFPCRVLEL